MRVEETCTTVCVPSMYVVSSGWSAAGGCGLFISDLGFEMVDMYGWTSREKLRVCFFSAPLLFSAVFSSHDKQNNMSLVIQYILRNNRSNLVLSEAVGSM